MVTPIIWERFAVKKERENVRNVSWYSVELVFVEISGKK